MEAKKHTVIDLFCGCGGFSLGFERCGCDVVLGIDIWNDALQTYRHNHKNSNAIQGDLLQLKPHDIIGYLQGKPVDIIIGGPPCQGFSVAGKRIVDDERNKLYERFVDFVRYFRPKVFVMENVPNILSIGNGIVKDVILKDFSEIGYTTEYKVMLAADFGVPQNRRRALFVGFNNGHHFEFPFPTHTDSKVSTWDAISDLPEHSLSDGAAYAAPPMSSYQKKMRLSTKGIFNHQTCVHSKQTVEIISLVPNGGNYKDLPIELQGTRKVHIAWTRLNSSKPSFTIDTGHRHHFHYQYNRIPTARECARIQSFPDDFVFLCSKTSQMKQIGNAVPPLMAEAIAKAVISQL